MDRVLETLTELRDTKHEAGLQFKCGRCGQVKSVPSGTCATGYGEWDAYPDKPICYDCCAEIDKEEMAKKDRYILYLSQGSEKTTGKYRGWYVSNWPGTLKIPAVTRSTNHSWPGVPRMDAWFVDATGQAWYGVNLGDNQIVRCRKIKRGAFTDDARRLAAQVKL